MSLNAYAETLFADPLFVTADEPTSVRLTVVSLRDLGLDRGGRYDEIVDRAAEQGLAVCAMEVAPHLRLSYLDQPIGPYLTIASLKLRRDEGYPNGFYLRHLDDGFWLRGYNAGADVVYSPDFTRFVFVEG